MSPSAEQGFAPAPIKATVSFEALEALDIRVGTILRVQELPRSKKLVRLQVDFGDHQRGVVVGMKLEREDPREVEGKQALFVVNLEPRRLMGTLSEAMLFDIGHGDGLRPVLACPEFNVPSGARAG
jgi:methionine--tRNA ligase beta chain